MPAKKRLRSDPFTDLLFNVLLGLTYLFLIAIMFMNPEAKSGIIDPKAEYILTVSWADNNTDDIDTWVEDPEGHIIYFRNRDSGLIHLDRDDRGMLNDFITVAGKKVENPLNQEVVTIRGVVKGEYVVNLHYHTSTTGLPVDAKVRLVKVNPKLEVVYYGTTTLDAMGHEKTVFRFSINRDGEVANINFLAKKLVALREQL